MLLIVLGIIDILAGFSLLFPNFLVFYIGVFITLKGVSSMFGIATKNVGIVIMGIVDIVAGLSLVFGFSIPLLWLLMIVKGSLSLVYDLGR
jgi:hypothetical protein